MTNPIDDGLVVVATLVIESDESVLYDNDLYDVNIHDCPADLGYGSHELVTLDNARAMIAKARKDALEEAAKYYARRKYMEHFGDEIAEYLIALSEHDKANGGQT